MKQIRGRAILIGLLILLSILYLLPTFFGRDGVPGWWPGLLPARQLSLGLDLRGGVHMVYEVEVEKAAEGEVRHLAGAARRALEGEDVEVKEARATDDGRILIELASAGGRGAVEEFFGDAATIDEGESTDRRLLLTPDAARLRQRMDDAVEQAIEIIRNRIDEFGVAEPTIQRQGSRRILVQLPGVENPEEAKRLVQDTAQLEFRLVDDQAEAKLADLLRGLTFADTSDVAEQKVDQTLGPRLPEGSEWFFQVERDAFTKQIVSAAPRILGSEVLLTGANLADARVSFGQLNLPEVSLTFDAEGARIFEDVTGRHRGKQLAVKLDDTVYSTPVIRTRIAGGRAVIEGNFDARSAHNLAIVLRAGSLPAPLTLLEERSVGPELGLRSVRQGQRSIAIGGALVVLFMALYYRRAGVYADVALVLNLVFLMAVLAGFNATLTLPGIAGIILTVGMAVDANVIVFERIREELRSGKSPRAAVDGGYAKALSSILDANVTTLIAALVLFQFGTGPVRGFAVTLSVGIVTSVFTALVVTRSLFDATLAKRGVKTLSI